MRGWYWKIRNLIFLFRANKNTGLVKRNHEEFIEDVFRIARKSFKGKNTWERNLLSSLIKKLRTESPYITGQYDSARELYEDYFTLENHIPSWEYLLEKVESGEEVWLTKFRDEAPVKGKRWCEYYTNSSWRINDFDVIKLGKPEKDWIYSEPYENGISVSKDFFTQYKFSTPEEITGKIRRDRKKQEIQNQIDQKQKELSKLYEQKSKV